MKAKSKEFLCQVVEEKRKKHSYLHRKELHSYRRRDWKKHVKQNGGNEQIKLVKGKMKENSKCRSKDKR
jgi:hypothetical protein